MEIFSIGSGEKTKAWGLIPYHGVLQGIDDRTRVSVHVNATNHVSTKVHEKNNLTIRLNTGQNMIISVPVRIENSYIGHPVDFVMGTHLSADAQGNLQRGGETLYLLKLHNPDHVMRVGNIKNLYDPWRLLRWVILFFSYAIFTAALLHLLHITHSSGNNHHSTVGLLLVMLFWAMPMTFATRWQRRANAAKRSMDAAMEKIFALLSQGDSIHYYDEYSGSGNGNIGDAISNVLEKLHRNIEAQNARDDN